MDELLNVEENKFIVSMADSSMMCILHSAMNKAHEHVRSRDGVLVRLSEQSKFCELAIMQLEACLKFVQDEADKCSSMSESMSYDKLISDLSEIKNRLHGRLNETEAAIVEKDREFDEKVEIECRLRKELEFKEKELEEFQERKQRGDHRDGDFCELKNSVDQHVWIIKQHWEGERIALTRRISMGSPCSVNLDSDSEMNLGSNQNIETSKVTETPICNQSNLGFDQMGLEIDKLKETLDTAFGVMQNAFLVSETHPLESQWLWMVEKSVTSILFKEYFVTEHDRNIKYFIREWVFMDVFREKFKDLKHCIEKFVNEVNEDTESKKIENLLTDNIFGLVLIESTKTIRSNIQQDDCTTRQSLCHVKSNHYHDAGLSVSKDNNATISEADMRLMKGLEQSGTSKGIIKETRDDGKIPEKNDVSTTKQDHIISSVNVFSQMLEDFEGVLHQKVDMHLSRLAKVEEQIKEHVKNAAKLKKKEVLYKKAFTRRCQNLQLAESEVDILGDQVDALLRLLQRIYTTLDYYSPILQHYTGVMDILIWIKKEFNTETVLTSKPKILIS